MGSERQREGTAAETATERADSESEAAAAATGCLTLHLVAIHACQSRRKLPPLPRSLTLLLDLLGAGHFVSLFGCAEEGAAGSVQRPVGRPARQRQTTMLRKRDGGVTDEE